MTAIGEPNATAIACFLVFVATTLGITWWAARRTATAEHACFVIGVPAVFQLAQGHFIGVLLGVVLLSMLPFIVRGYTVTPTHLEIHRLGWTTRLPLDGLRQVFARPGVMAWSWRIWGNGGVFAIHGWFSNGQLGRYRAFVTDPDRAVVLRWPEATIVVSPGEPDRFVRAFVGDGRSAG